MKDGKDGKDEVLCCLGTAVMRGDWWFGLLSEPGWAGLEDGLGWVVVGGHPCSIGGAGRDVRIWREGFDDA